MELQTHDNAPPRQLRLPRAVRSSGRKRRIRLPTPFGGSRPPTQARRRVRGFVGLPVGAGEGSGGRREPATGRHVYGYIGGERGKKTYVNVIRMRSPTRPLCPCTRSPSRVASHMDRSRHCLPGNPKLRNERNKIMARLTARAAPFPLATSPSLFVVRSSECRPNAVRMPSLVSAKFRGGSG
jgi:hypothetical protein